jgi:hypothetical protein
MSMSQEEIEALMSGADDIQVDEVEEINIEEEPTVDPEENIDIDDDINVDDILAGIDGIVDEEDINVDDILAGIDGVIDEEPIANDSSEVSDMESKINTNEYPLPVSAENKVVNQLNEVADDSEEKASQIFDVLSFILDENTEISKYNKSMSVFITQQAELLESLSLKFPNVDIFAENLSNAKELIETSNELSLKVDAENNKVFEAMELMQYHDINRQKIERVMAVIKKLSSYLNGIFEDDSGKAEVQIAKHISGDSHDIVDSDDIESLISEFSAD